MYKIIFNEDLEMDEYEKLIDFALSKSDAFMLVTYRDVGSIEEMFSTPPARQSLSEELQLMLRKSDEEDKKRKYLDVGIFKQKTEPFLEKIKPFLINTRNLPTEWPGKKVVFHTKYQSLDISVYKVCNDVREYLLEPKGIFNWKYPYFPDDLCFFKNGYCWFSTCAHEWYGCMFVDTYEDVEKLQNIGMVFNIQESDITEESLFYEKYKA